MIVMPLFFLCLSESFLSSLYFPYYDTVLFLLTPFFVVKSFPSFQVFSYSKEVEGGGPVYIHLRGPVKVREKRTENSYLDHYQNHQRLFSSERERGTSRRKREMLDGFIFSSLSDFACLTSFLLCSKRRRRAGRKSFSFLIKFFLLDVSRVFSLLPFLGEFAFLSYTLSPSIRFSLSLSSSIFYNSPIIQFSNLTPHLSILLNSTIHLSFFLYSVSLLSLALLALHPLADCNSSAALSDEVFSSVSFQDMTGEER
ncbi:hypothetical protein CSUI_008957 [Cystoisospora suis]|uniref:Transmembrane protein n=1 Tax=Cystoisospora suis TaxID=483139 RepID=A0A2C6KLG1_9APIC|nr:hypothetical protein CSUI_008957 [Cystoisospora suis]